MMSYKVETLLKNATSTIGEGPHWDDVTESLLYVDINSGDIHRWESLTGKGDKVHLDDTVGFVVPARKGGYMVGLGRSLSHLDWNSQGVTSLVEVDQGTKNRFNDGKCDPAGRLWAGTMGHEPRPTEVERHMGSLYSLDMDRKLKQHLDKIDISNGLAWTEDNRTMFYIDSIPRKVYAFDYDIGTGNINNQRTAVDFGEGTEQTMGFPDGMTIDTEGKIWVACFFSGKVIRFDVETGKSLLEVEIPAKRTTSCCWGGKNLDELYVTCAKHGATEEQFKTTESLAGSVFRVTGLGFKGKPAYVYEG